MEPTFNDYVNLIYNRFEAFVQSSDEVKKIGHPYVYQHQAMIVFFMWMQFKTIYQFKTQWRWLTKHPEALPILGWTSVPHRTTLSRRYKALALSSYYRVLKTKRIELAMQDLLCNQMSPCIETLSELITIVISGYEVFLGMEMVVNRIKYRQKFLCLWR